MISVIIPVYKQADKLPKILDSLARQTYRDFEVLVVDDGSPDQVEAALLPYLREVKEEGRVAFFRQPHQGAPAARNLGARQARGDYLFFCDADAVLEPVALQTLFDMLRANPAASYAYPSFRWGRKLFSVGDFSPEKLRQGPLVHTMALVRRSDFPAGGWDERIKKFQDWDLWLTMLAAGQTGVWVPKVLFTVAPGGTMSSWLPRAAYRLLPFLPAVKRYERALKVIKDKHGLV